MSRIRAMSKISRAQSHPAKQPAKNTHHPSTINQTAVAPTAIGAHRTPRIPLLPQDWGFRFQEPVVLASRGSGSAALSLQNRARAPLRWICLSLHVGEARIPQRFAPGRVGRTVLRKREWWLQAGCMSPCSERSVWVLLCLGL